MLKNKLKLLIWGCLVVVGFVGVLASINVLGRIYAHFNTGADPRNALNLLPVAPADIDERLTWLPDIWQGRPLDQPSRDKIAGAYLHGWAQWNISYEIGEPRGLKTYYSGPALLQVTETITKSASGGWEILQSDLNHNLQLNFVSEDENVVSLTDYDVTVVQILTHPETDTVEVIETVATYDIVMILEAGNWRVRFWQRWEEKPRLTPPEPFIPVMSVDMDQPSPRPVSNLSWIAARSARSIPESTRDWSTNVWEQIKYVRGAAGPAKKEAHYVQVDGNKFTLQGEPFHVAGVSYYAQDSPWNDFWPSYSPQVTKADFEIVRSLGLNTVTIFIPFAQWGGSEGINQTYLANFKDLLNQADQHDLKVFVVLFDHHTDHSLPNWAGDDRFLAELIPEVADHPAILAWDVKNEPNRDYVSNRPEVLDAWLTHVARRIREHDPNHLVTIGWSLPEPAQNLVDVVDFISYHYFAPADEYPRRLAELKAVSKGKPLLLQELVRPTWNPVFFPHGHTEAEQAEYFAKIISVQRVSEGAGYITWTLYDFDKVPLDEFHLPWSRGQQSNMGIIRRNGTFKPAASLLRPGADLTWVQPVPAWRRFLKPFWLMVITTGSSSLILIWAFVRRHTLRRYWRLVAGNESLLGRSLRFILALLTSRLRRIRVWVQRYVWLDWLLSLPFRGLGWLRRRVQSLIQQALYYMPWKVLMRFINQRANAWKAETKQRKRLSNKEPTPEISPPPIQASDMQTLVRSEIKETLVDILREIQTEQTPTNGVHPPQQKSKASPPATPSNKQQPSKRKSRRKRRGKKR